VTAKTKPKPTRATIKLSREDHKLVQAEAKRRNKAIGVLVGILIREEKERQANRAAFDLPPRPERFPEWAGV
jgi:hypothetical protein